MVADRLFRVVYVSTNQPESQIRTILGRCGAIRGLYPWRIGDHRGHTHFFVEFESSEAAQRAKALKPPLNLFSIHSVAYNAHMTANFISVAPPQASETSKREGASHKKRGEGGPNKDGGSRRVSTGRRRPPASFKKRNSFSSNAVYVHHDDTPSMGMGMSGYMQSGDGEAKLLSSQINAPEYEADVYRPGKPPYDTAPQLSAQLSYAATHPISSVHASSSNPQPTNLTNVDCPVPCVKSEPIDDGLFLPASLPTLMPGQKHNVLRPLPPKPPPSAAPSLVLCYEGEQFICELDALTEDPENVIFLLQQTAISATERDKWMVVAAHYRRNQNISAAAAVMASMLDAMKSADVGLLDQDLKPTYLMLASCYNDLRRRAHEGSDAGSHEEYLAKAQDCLQKVYGASEPTSSLASALPAPASSADFSSSRSNKSKRALTTQVETGEARQAEELQREIQSLRDSHANNMANLADARRAKRKLEDDLNEERVVRKKIEVEFKEKNDELESVRRSEEFALELCKREVLSRRKAEDEAAEAVELREKVKKLHHEVDEKEARIRELDAKEQQKREIIARAGVMLVESTGLDIESLKKLSATMAGATGVSPSRSMPMGPPSLSAKRERAASVTSSTRAYRERDRSSSSVHC